MEQTLLLIKSHAINHIHEIHKAIIDKGLHVLAGINFELPVELAHLLYMEHIEKPHFQGIIDSVTDGPIVAFKVEGLNAIIRVRALVGATDPAKADKGTLRERFGVGLPLNAVHASDSAESAERELQIIFG